MTREDGAHGGKGTPGLAHASEDRTPMRPGARPGAADADLGQGRGRDPSARLLPDAVSSWLTRSPRVAPHPSPAQRCDTCLSSRPQ